MAVEMVQSMWKEGWPENEIWRRFSYNVAVAGVKVGLFAGLRALRAGVVTEQCALCVSAGFAVYFCIYVYMSTHQSQFIYTQFFCVCGLDL